MKRFVILFAPKTPAQWVGKVGAFLLAVLCLDIALVPLLTGQPAHPVNNMLMAVSVALPFVTLGFFLISRLYQMQSEMEIMARTDALTGLPNRRAFFAEAEAAERGLLFLIDLDRFKAINDSHGHAVGDQCLMAFADHLRVAIRPEDLAARTGGEEFAVLIRSEDGDAARSVADRISRGIDMALAASPRGSGGTLRVTASIGIARFGAGGSFSDLFVWADHLLYRAKAAGRARYEIAQGPPAAG